MNMNDLISRQKAIEALGEKPVGDTDWDLGCRNQWEWDTEILRTLPTAEPERKWIPVTEELPEEREWLGTKRFRTTISDEVYVTFENPKGERFCKHLSFQNGKLSRFDQSTIDAFYPEAKLIAWMPLPEPYRGE